MITYTLKGVLPHAVKVTQDRDLFADPKATYAVLEARIDVETLRAVEIDAEDADMLADDDIARTKHTRISLEPNPRTQNMKTPVAKAIKTSLLRRDGKFHRLNRGVLFNAKTFAYDNKKRELTWTEEDPLTDGDLDGGHTLKIIDETVGTKEWVDKAKEMRGQRKAVLPQFVTLQILKGVSFEDLPKIAEGRNHSVNVETFALEELAKQFEFLKGELSKTRGLREIVAFKQNEIRDDGKEMDVVYLLQLLTVLDNREFDGENQPYVAYWSRKKTVGLFVAKRDNYHRLKGLIRDALALKEYIVLNYEKWYGETNGRTGSARPRFRRTNECVNDKTTEFWVLPLMKPRLSPSVDYRLVTEGLAMPILAALRTIVSVDEEAKWLRDPYEFLDQIGPTLVESLTDALLAQRNPVVALKRKGVWSALFDKTRIRLYQESQTAKRSKKAAPRKKTVTARKKGAR